MLEWGSSDRYEAAYRIGSQDEDGGHRRDVTGWPYSIYLQAAAPGVTDVVLCDGIRDMRDAERLVAAVNDIATSGWASR